MPGASLPAARDHATPAATANGGLDAAHALIDELREVGVPFNRTVEEESTKEGLASFSKSFESLIETVSTQLQQTATKA